LAENTYKSWAGTVALKFPHRVLFPLKLKVEFTIAELSEMGVVDSTRFEIANPFTVP
jgi:hypothetical protein